MKPAKKREVVAYLVSEYPMNIRQACKSLDLERSSYYYHPKRKDDTKVIDCLNQLSEKHPSYGFKKLFHSLRNQGFGWNHKKVYRVYKKLGLNLLRKRRRRLASRDVKIWKFRVITMKFGVWILLVMCYSIREDSEPLILLMIRTGKPFGLRSDFPLGLCT
ncbi:IS3 family transposase [Chryseobacterium sp. PS-8]|uniref:IS3 family transposase n=1 Tax=Chryseobacterium indicum TaxID=2766954 RepID=A0ABS9C7T9_9FLAO|nr:IS3 family transposase [Chryseobacterium sp. PS-8]MCF2220040.1 IS3 family transposase [Chryseobacterium sp. PS-8]